MLKVVESGRRLSIQVSQIIREILDLGLAGHADSDERLLGIAILRGPYVIPPLFAIGLSRQQRYVVAAVEHGRRPNVAPSQEFVRLTAVADLNDLRAGLDAFDPCCATGTRATDNSRHFLDAESKCDRRK